MMRAAAGVAALAAVLGVSLLLDSWVVQQAAADVPDLSTAKPRQLQRIIQEQGHPYRHLVERDELERAAHDALRQLRTSRAGLAPLLSRAARYTRSEQAAQHGILLFYFVGVVGLPLMLLLCCLREGGNGQGFTVQDQEGDNPLAQPNNLDPFRMPGIGWSTMPWADHEVEQRLSERAKLRQDIEAVSELFVAAGREEVKAGQLGSDGSDDEEECRVCLGPLCSPPELPAAAAAADADDDDDDGGKSSGQAGNSASLCLRLRCGHAYHESCVMTWLVDRNGLVCPTCRAPVIE